MTFPRHDRTFSPWLDHDGRVTNQASRATIGVARGVVFPIAFSVVFASFSIFMVLLVVHDKDLHVRVGLATIAVGTLIGLMWAVLVLRRQSRQELAPDDAPGGRAGFWDFLGISGGASALAIAIPDLALLPLMAAMLSFCVAVLVVAVHNGAGLQRRH